MQYVIQRHAIQRTERRTGSASEFLSVNRDEKPDSPFFWYRPIGIVLNSKEKLGLRVFIKNINAPPGILLAISYADGIIGTTPLNQVKSDSDWQEYAIMDIYNKVIKVGKIHGFDTSKISIHSLFLNLQVGQTAFYIDDIEFFLIK